MDEPMQNASLTFKASILRPAEVEKASSWYHDLVGSVNPTFTWIVGTYIEADVANENKQMFPMVEIEKAAHTLLNSPVNINHNSAPMGTFIGSQLVFPEDSGLPAKLEVVSAIWPNVDPVAYRKVEQANEEGSLYYSMENLPRFGNFVYPDGASEILERDPYKAFHVSYPAQYEAASQVEFIDVTFTGGALIVPPITPGLSRARAGIGTTFTEAASAIVLESETMPEDSDGTVVKETAEDSDIPKESTNVEADVLDVASKEGDKVPDITMTDVPDDVQTQIVEAFLSAHAVDEQAEALKADIAALQTKLDQAEAAKASAESKVSDVANYLEAVKTEADEAAALEARKSDRVAEIAKLVTFSDEYVTENADRWAAQSEDDFAATLSVIAEAHGTKTEVSEDDESTESEKAALHVTLNTSSPGTKDTFRDALKSHLINS